MADDQSAPLDRTEHWWKVASWAIAGSHDNDDIRREVEGRIALLFTQLSPRWRKEIMTKALTLTQTNCWWATYHVGQVVLNHRKAIDTAKRRPA